LVERRARHVTDQVAFAVLPAGQGLSVYGVKAFEFLDGDIEK
jgi:hypothetical protein